MHRRAKTPARKTTGIGLAAGDLPWLQRVLVQAIEAADWEAVERLGAVGRMLHSEKAQFTGRTASAAVRGMPSASFELAYANGDSRRIDLKVQRTTRTARHQQTEFQRRYWTARSMGEDVAHFPHPFDQLARLRAAFDAMREAGQHKEVSAWRRWTYRWHKAQLGHEDGLPMWMKPKQRGGTPMKHRTTKTERIANDPTHELGERQEMLALFDSMDRREQASVIGLTRLATGSVPMWMVVQAEQKRGPKPGSKRRK